MPVQVPKFLPYLFAYCTLFGIIYAGFNATEALLRPHTKRCIGRWLGEPNESKRIFDEEWTASLIDFFDTLFVPKHRRSWRFPLPGFWRSAGFSILFAAMMSILFSTLGIDLGEEIRKLAKLTSLNVPILLFVMLGMILIFNLVPDYVSIVEMRYILSKMKFSHHAYICIFVDMIVTLLISWLFPFMLGLFFHLLGFYEFSSINILTYLNEYIKLVSFNLKNNDFYMINIFVYSTFLTSIWIWLYAIGGLPVSISVRVAGFRRFLDRHTVLEDRPLSVMGWMLIAAMTAIFGGYIGIMLLVPMVA